MAEYKREYNFYPYYDSDGMAAHFEEMSLKGWMLDRVAEKRVFFRYRKIQPAKIKFAVTYFADASVYDSSFTEEQKEYIDYCSRAGWNRVDSRGQLQVFYNENENPVPLETDSLLTVEIIHDSMKNSYLLGNAAMMAVCILQLFVGWKSFTGNVINYLTEPIYSSGTLIWVLLLIFYIIETGRYYIWYRKAMKSAREHSTIPPVRNGMLWGRISTAILLAAAAGLILILMGINPVMALGVIIFTALNAVLSLTVPAVAKRFGADNASSKKYGTVTIIIAVSVMFFIYRNWLSGLDIKYYPGGRKPVYVIENYLEDLDFDVYRDELPLYIQDLTGEKDNEEAYSYEAFCKENFAVDYKKYMQVPLPDYELPMLRYEVVTPKGKHIYRLCLDSYMHEFDRFNKSFAPENQYRYEETDSSAWNGGKAYRLRGGYSNKSPRYLIVYPDYFIFILSETELTQRQQAVMYEKLKDL